MLRSMDLGRQHLVTVNESYLQHLGFAARTGMTMIVAGGACIVHGLCPFLFERTGSRTIESLADRIRSRRGR